MVEKVNIGSYYLGARLSPAPELQLPYDIAKRDRLFDELQHLRQQQKEIQQQIADLEKQLNDLFG